MNGRSIEDILSESGVYVSPTVGVSMRPMLRQGKDRVILVPPQGRLKKYDVPLYRRGQDYVLHRIVAVRPDDYVVLGDNCSALEYVRDEQIVGVLTGFYRAGRYVKLTDPFYRAYCVLWPCTRPIRRLISRAVSIKKRIMRPPRNR